MIDINDVIIEKDTGNGEILGHVIDISPNWLTIHWLSGANTALPSGQWACPIHEAHAAIESGEWEVLSATERYEVET